MKFFTYGDIVELIGIFKNNYLNFLFFIIYLTRSLTKKGPNFNSTIFPYHKYILLSLKHFYLNFFNIFLFPAYSKPPQGGSHKIISYF